MLSPVFHNHSHSVIFLDIALHFISNEAKKSTPYIFGDTNLHCYPTFTFSVTQICTAIPLLHFRCQICPSILLLHNMAGFNTLLCFVFMLGLMSSASPARAPAPSPIAAARNASPVQSPAAPSPASPPPATSPTVSSPAFAPSKVATPPSSASSPTVQTLASGPSAQGPDTASPPNPSSGAVSTATVGKMAIFGAALVGGAAFLL